MGHYIVSLRKVPASLTRSNGVFEVAPYLFRSPPLRRKHQACISCYLSHLHLEPVRSPLPVRQLLTSSQTHLYPHRTVAPHMVSSLCGIFSMPVNARTQAKDETDAGYAHRLTGQPVSVHPSVLVYGLQGSGGAQTPAKDDPGGSTSGFPPPQPPVSLADDGIRTIHTAVRDEAKRLSRRGSGDSEVRTRPVIVALVDNKGS